MRDHGVRPSSYLGRAFLLSSHTYRPWEECDACVFVPPVVVPLMLFIAGAARRCCTEGSATRSLRWKTAIRYEASSASFQQFMAISL
jgi:hypothetical protein